MSDVNIQTFSGKVNVSNNFTVGSGHLFVDTQNNKVGLNTTTPEANLHVTGNTYISTDISVGGTLTMGTVTVEALHSLDAVTSVGNTTPHTVEFQNTDTSLVASGNVEMAKELTVSGNAAVYSNLTVSGNVEVGTANLFVDTVNSRVGIGTTSPTTKFTIYGDNTEDEGGLLMKVVDKVNLNNGFTGIGLGGYLQVAKSAIIHERNAFYGRGNLMFCNSDTADTTDVSNTHARMTITSTGDVGIATTTPRTTLHVTDDTDTTGTGDAFISGLAGNTSNRKPTECLRLQGKWYSPGSGALLRFTNQHPQGTFPNAGEYNLAGIAGYDHDNNWGGGLAFYTSPGTGTGGDDLTLRMSIDSTGHVNIPGPTTGANHGPASMLYLLDTGFFKEFSYTNSETPNVKITFNSTSEIPTGAKAVLAEVFLSRDSLSGNGDHQIHVMGKNHTANQQNWLGGAGQPSPTFGNGVDTRQTVEILMPGESDGFTHYFGNWHSSVIIPLENNQIYYSNYGNSSSTGWVYVKIRGYYI
jgi:hypothetical protein